MVSLSRYSRGMDAPAVRVRAYSSNEPTIGTSSSDLIREAVMWARKRWPAERLFTFVDPAAIRSPRPGACFRIAGWQRVDGVTARGLIELEVPRAILS